MTKVRGPSEGPDETGSRRIPLSPEPAVARHQLGSILSSLRWAGNVDDALLALNEALVNAGQHAGGVRRAEASVGSSLVIQIWDRGRGFDPVPYAHRPPELLAEHGRGVWLMSRVADSCEVHRDGRGHRLVLRFEAARRGGSVAGSSFLRSATRIGAVEVALITLICTRRLSEWPSRGVRAARKQIFSSST